MYTVFVPGWREPRHNRIGLPIFCRTIAACIREGAEEGDKLQRWSNAGGNAGRFSIVRAKSGRLVARRDA